jgi:HEAT repeat protein
MVRSDDPRTQLVGAALLKTLSKDHVNAVLEAGGVPPLVRQLRNADLETRQHVSETLFNLSVVEEVRDAIVANEGLAPLVELLSADNRKVQRNAAGTIANLATNTENKEALVRMSVLPPLVKIIRDSESDRLSQQSCRALFALAANAALKVTVVAAGALPPLIRCLRSNSETVQSHAAGAIANLAIHTATKAQIIADGGLTPLCTLTHSSDERVLRQVTRALFALAAKPDLRPLIVQTGVLRPLVRLLSFRHAEVQRNSAGVIGNLALTDPFRTTLVEAQALCPLIRLAESEHEAVQQQAARALFNLSYTNDERDAAWSARVRSMVDHRGIEALVSLVRSSNVDIQHDAAGALANLAAGAPANKAEIARHGGLKPLVQLLTSPRSNVQNQAARTVATLACVTELQSLIAQAGALPPLIGLLGSDSSEVQQHATLALANLAALRQNQSLLVPLGALEPLVHTSISPHAAVQRNAIVCLNHIGIRGVPPCSLPNAKSRLRYEVHALLEQERHSDCHFVLLNGRHAGTSGASRRRGDAAVVVERVRAHRVVLAARSPHFRKRFAMDGKRKARGEGEGEGEGEELVLGVGCGRAALIRVLEFMYSGMASDMDREPENAAVAREVHALARHLKLDALAQVFERLGGGSADDKGMAAAYTGEDSAPDDAMHADLGRLLPLEHAAAAAAPLRHLCDIVLVASDGSRFEAHRALLWARCPYFRAMFESGMRESAQREVRVDERPQVLREMLRYVYAADATVMARTDAEDTEGVEDTEGNRDGGGDATRWRRARRAQLLLELMGAANKHMLDGLQLLCEETLAQGLEQYAKAHPGCVNAILEAATQMHAQRLRARCLLYCLQRLGAPREQPQPQPQQEQEQEQPQWQRRAWGELSAPVYRDIVAQGERWGFRVARHPVHCTRSIAHDALHPKIAHEDCIRGGARASERATATIK